MRVLYNQVRNLKRLLSTQGLYSLSTDVLTVSNSRSGALSMAARNLSALSKDEVKTLFSSVDTILTDCDVTCPFLFLDIFSNDSPAHYVQCVHKLPVPMVPGLCGYPVYIGVLWLHTKALPGSPEVLNQFRKMGKRVFYITNNNVITRDDFLVKCQELGFSAVKEDVLTSSYLTACYLQDIGFKKKVYIVGTSGISRELNLVGIKNIGVGPDPLLTDITTLVMKDFKLDPEVAAVIVGFDEHFSYPKMLKAASYLNQPDCLFIAANSDERGPSRVNNCIIPGTGSMVAAIETCVGRKPFLIGKPSAYIIDVIRKRYNVDPGRTLMIGDRCNTDILVGTRCGFKTLLVLSGVNTLEDVMYWEKSDKKEDRDLVPDYYIGTLGDLLPMLS